ncbi:MAG: hypothetical protein M1837_002269 [Sclerophora amabilis]|nr:MAG: hypothetical protein M1837_002269 [Sclerophora amabilis]
MGKGTQFQASNRPNFNKIHALPLPLKIHPLPTFIPHNPISLLHLIYVYFTHVLVPPSSHPERHYKAVFSPETRSVHITDPVAIHALWESGFFGKGSLSRSEPNWLDKERRRQGQAARETSEEITLKRRKERREFKNERARKEREAIELRLQEESKAKCSKHRIIDPVKPEEEPYGSNETKDHLEPTHATHEDLPVFDAPNTGASSTSTSALEKSLPNETDEIAPLKGLQTGAKNVHFLPTPKDNNRIDGAASKLSRSYDNGLDFESQQVISQEHLQLTFEEALFLVYGLGILDISDRETGNILQTSSLFLLFRQHSYFPPTLPQPLSVDDPFLLSYVVYHHFRSLGWVVRSGIKFAVDWLLYKRGPVFSHAEFAVVILPSYLRAGYLENEAERKQCLEKECKPWWWLHCANRVQSQVRKSLLLVYVEIPSPETAAPERDEDIGRLLGRYRVREMSLKRWIPNRSRD